MSVGRFGSLRFVSVIRAHCIVMAVRWGGGGGGGESLTCPSGL
jgi:hypothetical protein